MMDAAQSGRPGGAPNFAGVAYAEAIERARALVPVLRSRAAAAEAARTVPAETLADLHASGLLRALQPKRWGGMEFDFIAYVDIPLELARGCASTGWNMGNLLIHHWLLALYDERAQAEVWGTDPQAMIASGVAFPQGSGRKVDGGFVVNGRWNFSSGVNIADESFLKGLRQLCDERGMLLIFDEVQTGLGRTGHWFGYQHSGVQPDIMTLAKGLAAGVACGAFVCRDHIAPSLRPGMHASTFGGNPLAMAAGIATIQTIEEEGLLAHCQKMAERFRGHFAKLKDELPIIKDLRVRGMMVGVELSIPATPAVGKCMERGVLINATHDTVIRLLPPLNITPEQVDEGCAVDVRARETAAAALHRVGGHPAATPRSRAWSTM